MRVRRPSPQCQADDVGGVSQESGNLQTMLHLGTWEDGVTMSTTTKYPLTAAFLGHKDKLEFAVEVEVLAKQGDRARIVTPPKGKPFVTHYPRKAQVGNAEQLASVIQPSQPRFPMRGPLEVEMCIVVPWRIAEPKRVTQSGQYRRKDTHPDCDNLGKQVLDVLEAQGFIESDALVTDLIIRKRWGPKHILAVRIQELDLMVDPN